MSNNANLNREIHLTPSGLLEDNQSRLAQNALVAWNEMEHRGLLITVWGCSDARFILPDPYRVNVIRTIAASGSSQPFESLLTDRSSTSILLVIHHDGDTFRKGQALQGCGGLAARKSLSGEGQSDEEGIEHFIETNVNHPDPLVQASIRASAISHRSGKTVLASTQDHLTGRIIPFALVRWTGSQTEIRTAVLPHYSYQNVYRSDKLYAEGIPQLSRHDLENYAPEYIQLLDEHDRNLAKLHNAIPNLRNKQKIQQPHSVIIKTGRRPKELTYPKHFGLPGSGFTIIVPRYIEDNNTKRTVSVHKDDINNVIDQAEYPINLAAVNYRNEEKPFSTVTRIYIETPSLGTSKQIAKQMSQKPWLKAWLDKSSENKIILGQEYKGILEEADWFKP